MKGSILEKILLNHTEKTDFQPGDVIPIKVDHIFIADNSAVPILKAMDDFHLSYPKCPVYLGLTYFHYQQQKNYPEIQMKIINDAQKHQFIVMGELQGHWHHNLLNMNKIKPGNVVVGSDSTINFFSPLNTLSISCGSSDIIKTILTGNIDYLVPRLVNINLIGKLLPQTNAKDVALFLKQEMEALNLKNFAVEFSGTHLATLTQNELHTLSFHHYTINAENFLFPPVIFNRNNTKTIKPDAEAKYYKELRFDVSKLEPMVKLKHEVYSVSDLESIKMHKVFIGNTIGGTIEDFEFLAKILKGKKVAIPCFVTPACNDVLKAVTQKGYLTQIIESGCTLLNPSTGICQSTNGVVVLKNENVLSSGIASLSMSTGKSKANVYTGSVKTAIATAISGKLTSLKEFL
ncbi:MAG: aconitase family protein [Candidatus Margulisbacteria bacterium]|nr:aconitase family protein [Candidatus Margulisiibacteriota bacterium]